MRGRRRQSDSESESGSGQQGQRDEAARGQNVDAIIMLQLKILNLKPSILLP